MSISGDCKDVSVQRTRLRLVVGMVKCEEHCGQNVSSCVDRKMTASDVKQERMSAAECGYDNNSPACSL